MPTAGLERSDADRSSPRPPRRWRPVVGVLSAVAVAAAVVAVAWNLDREEAEKASPRFDPADITDLVEPDPLTDQERASLDGPGGGGIELSTPAGVALAEGGWIEVADELGRLKQRYAASRMDPLPDGWVEMVQPRALVFGRQGRVTALEGGFGTARMPEREIESGTLREDVRIRFFRPEGETPVSVEEDEPWLVIEAESADFDGAEGRIRCDGAVSVTSAELEFAGVNLLVLLQPDGREIERLVVERATSPLRLRPRPRSRADDEPAPEAEPTPEPSSAPAVVQQESAPTTNGGGTVASAAEMPTFMRLVLDGGVSVVRAEGDRRLSIDGDRLAAVFAMEGDGLGSIAAGPNGSPESASSPMPASTWLAATVLTVSSAGDSEPEGGEVVEIDFGGSLLIEPVESGVPVPSTADEVWVRVEGRDVRLHEQTRDARIRCDLLDLRTGGREGDRVDLLAGAGVVEIDAPGLELRAPAVRVRGSRVLVAGPGAMRLQSDRDADAAEAPETPEASPLSAEAVEIQWADRLDLTLGPEQERLRRALFDGGESGRVRVRSEGLSLDADSLDVAFLEAATAEAGEDRIDRIAASGEVVAIRPDGIARLDADRLVVEMRQDPDAARPGRIEATGGVRAFDAERVLWASSLEAFLGPGEAPESNESDRTGGERLASPLPVRADVIESVEARGDVVAGLADGTWVFAEGFAARPGDGRLRLDGGDVAMSRDGALLDGLRGLSLVDAMGQVEARTDGPGRLQAARQVLLDPWIPPSPADLDEWTWPETPIRPTVPETLAVAAVWEGGLRYLESRVDSPAGVEVATLEVAGRVRARSIDEEFTEDRLSGDRLRVGFARPTEVSPDRGAKSSKPDPDPNPDPSKVESLATGQSANGLEIASMDLEGGASLERRRMPPNAESAERPDLLRIAGERIVYEVPTGEGRVPGAGTLLVSEAPTATREARTARFRWKERLDLERRGDAETAVAISGEVDLAFAGGVAGPAFTLTADRMDATLRPRSSSEEADEPIAETSDLGRLELRDVAGAGRVFARGQGRDVECDAFDYDADTGMLVLTARPGRSVGVMSTTAAAPVRAERVRWNLRTDRIEIDSARGEG